MMMAQNMKSRRKLVLNIQLKRDELYYRPYKMCIVLLPKMLSL